MVVIALDIDAEEINLGRRGSARKQVAEAIGARRGHLCIHRSDSFRPPIGILELPIGGGIALDHQSGPASITYECEGIGEADTVVCSDFDAVAAGCAQRFEQMCEDAVFAAFGRHVVLEVQQLIGWNPGTVQTAGILFQKAVPVSQSGLEYAEAFRQDLNVCVRYVDALDLPVSVALMAPDQFPIAGQEEGAVVALKQSSVRE